MDALVTLINNHCVAVSVFWLLAHNTDMLAKCSSFYSHLYIDISSLIVKIGFYMYFSAT